MSKVILNICQSEIDDCFIYISGSKSISQRALIIHFLASFSLDVNNLSDCQDTFFLKKILTNLDDLDHINVGQGGTTLRFLLSVLSIQKKKFYVEGDSSLKNRPLNSLLNALNSIGVNFNFLRKKNQLPFELEGEKIISKPIYVDGNKTSQFVSSLLLVSPYIKGGIQLEIKNKIVSKSYINMTVEIMRKCGANIFWCNNQIRVKEGEYKKPILSIESDWSSLSYIYQLVAFSKKANITVSSFSYPSIQKDSDLVLFFDLLGVKTIFDKNLIKIKRSRGYKLPYNIEWDILETPDLMPTYVISCFALGVNLTLKGIDTLIYKESNRVKSVTEGLNKFNACIKLLNGNLILDSTNPIFNEQVIDSYNDHRIALAFSALVLKTKKLTINNPSVVNKSYPAFWEHLKKTGITVVFQK